MTFSTLAPTSIASITHDDHQRGCSSRPTVSSLKLRVAPRCGLCLPSAKRRHASGTPRQKQQQPHQHRSTVAPDQALSADVLSSRTASADSASAQAARYQVLLQRRTQHKSKLSTSSAAPPSGNYVSALLHALATSDAAVSDDESIDNGGPARRKAPQRRGQRRGALLDRVKLHAAYLQPALDAEFTEEWAASESRLQLSRKVLQVRAHCTCTRRVMHWGPLSSDAMCVTSKSDDIAHVVVSHRFRERCVLFLLCFAGALMCVLVQAEFNVMPKICRLKGLRCLTW